jgi:hypothetical protein
MRRTGRRRRKRRGRRTAGAQGEFDSGGNEGRGPCRTQRAQSFLLEGPARVDLGQFAHGLGKLLPREFLPAMGETGEDVLQIVGGDLSELDVVAELLQGVFVAEGSFQQRGRGQSLHRIVVSPAHYGQRHIFQLHQFLSGELREELDLAGLAQRNCRLY